MATPGLENLSMKDEGEEEGFCFDLEEDGHENSDLQWCLVGRFLCDRAIHFQSLKKRIADIWRPMKGVNIKETTNDLLLFQFSLKLDMQSVLKEWPWTFDSHLSIHYAKMSF